VEHVGQEGKENSQGYTMASIFILQNNAGLNKIIIHSYLIVIFIKLNVIKGVWDLEENFQQYMLCYFWKGSNSVLHSGGPGSLFFFIQFETFILRLS